MPILKADFPMMKTIIAAFTLPLFLLAASPAPASETSGAPAASEAQSKLAPESSAARASASAMAEPPAVRHEPEPDTGREGGFPAGLAGGVAVVAVLLAWLYFRRRSRAKVGEARDAQDAYWNPVKVVPFGKDEEKGNPDALTAVSKTVEAVMEAEKGWPEGEAGMTAAAQSVLKGLEEFKEKAGKAGDAPKDTEAAWRAMMRAWLDEARAFAAKGLTTEAREIAEEAAKGPDPELKEEAKAFIRTLPPKKPGVRRQ